MTDADRGVSELVSYVLVITLVLTTVGIVSVAGLEELGDVRASEQVNNAERAFDLLASNIDDVALREAPSRSTELTLDNARVSLSDPIEIQVRGIDDSNPANNITSNHSIWPIRYQADHSSAQILYIGGSVMRVVDQGTVILRQPAIIAEDERVAIPLINTRTRSVESRAGGTVQIGTEHGTTTLPVYDTSGTYDTVFVNVTSPRAAAWQEILGGHEAFGCTLDTSGPTDRVWCEAANPDRVAVSHIQIDVTLTR